MNPCGLLTNDVSEMDKELSLAVEVVRQAGQIVMDVYATDFAVAYKSQNDPVTEADQRANDLIVESLTRNFPHDLVVAEESPKPEVTQPASRVWYVDPLDGTKEFIGKNGEFSVMIGLAVKGRPRLGVVYRPHGDVLYAGVVGMGAWMEHEKERMSLVTKEQDPGNPITMTASRSHRHPLLETISQDLGVGKEIPLGSVGLKIGLIAAGEADMYLEPGPYTKLWDTCGPEAILRAAGGQFTNVLGQPLIYGVPQLNNTRGLLATNGFCHARVVQALEPLLDTLGLKSQDGIV